MLSVCFKLTNSKRFRVKTANSSNNSLLLQNIKHPKSQYRAVYTEPVHRVHQKMLSIHYRLNRVWVGRFKSAGGWVSGSDSRGGHQQMGEHRGAGMPAVGPCVTGTHTSVGEHRQWAETGLLDLLEIRWKRKDMRGIRWFWIGFRNEEIFAKGQQGLRAHRIQNQKVSKYICKWGIITESECFYWGPTVSSVLGSISSLIYQWPRRKQTIFIVRFVLTAEYKISPRTLTWSLGVTQ